MATLKSMFKLYDGYSNTISKIEKKTDEATNKILKASGATDKFNNQLEQTGASANKGSSGLGKFISIAAMVAGAIKGMSISDEYTNTASRLNLINDGLQTQAELQDKIFASANRSRGAYSEMAGAISKMGLLAGDAFTSNDELIAFTELVQKSFKVGGADTSEQMGAMRQLTQAMASGRLQGDELVSIMENAPMVYDAISKYMELSKGELKKLSSEGAITSDIIKNAMFDAGADINIAFEKMPMTFGDIWTKIKNGALKAFDPVIRKINKLINTEKFQKFIDKIIGGINLIAKFVEGLIDVIVKSWDIIKPILAVIATVWLVTIIAKLWAMIPPLIAQAGAWLAIYWPVLLVIGIIAAAIWIVRQFGATWEEIFGAAGGTVGTFAANLNNSIAYMVNPLIAFINFVGNAFTDLGASIKMFFWDIAYTVISGISAMVGGVASSLNLLPYVDIDATSNLDTALAGIDNIRAKIKEESNWKEIIAPMDFINHEEAWSAGSEVGINILDTIKETSKAFSDTINNKGFDIEKYLNDNVINIQGAVDVNMSDEDLRYLRDIAERDYINKFSSATLAPNVSFTFGDIRETADVNEIKGTLEMMMREEIAVAAEGSY